MSLGIRARTCRQSTEDWLGVWLISISVYDPDQLASDDQIILNIIKLQLQSQFQRFLNQTLCVYSKMKDIKHIRRILFGCLGHADEFGLQKNHQFETSVRTPGSKQSE